MSARSVLARGRKAHGRLYVDTCVITRVTGSTLDGENVLTDTVVTVYSGACRLKRPTTQAAQAQAGEQAVRVREYELHMPWDAPTPVLEDDVATLTASDDTWAIGRPLTVIDAGLSGSTTARRLIVEARS